MSVRVRFAPSPTGYLHIGGARTALYNYLYAKHLGGKYILRIEDTDLERSTREFETSQIADLKWLGLEHDEGPDVGGEYGPYRQSERLDIYKKYAEQLVEQGHAFYCFCSDEELEAKREQAEKEGGNFHYAGTCRNNTKEEVAARKAKGEQYVIRFRAKDKEYALDDHVRGHVVFPKDMVGDFVILRSNGLPVYNFSVVIDDWLMKITHVFRAEEHLNNTVRQLMIYEALGATPPQFGHMSLIIGKDRQKLSKRHGATSVSLYREMQYLPNAVLNYLCLLGWSHPEEKDIFTPSDLIPIFDSKRFNKAPAIFDLEKFAWVNSQHLRALSIEELVAGVDRSVPAGHPYHSQTTEWKQTALTLIKEKIQFFGEAVPHLDEIFSPTVEMNDALKEILSWPTTPQIKEYLKLEVEKLVTQGKERMDGADLDQWSNHIKNELKIKGKPLFQGMRGVLTGRDHGPDLKILMPLTPLKIVSQRLK